MSVRLAGLVSGTSADGVDAALIRVEGRSKRIALEAFVMLPYPRGLRDRVLGVAGGAAVGAPEIAALDTELGELFAKAAFAVAKKAGVAMSKVDAIGSHGQTIYHAPRARPATTMQIGDAAVIAERTGVTVVADFRRRDVAAGGEGAPLVPRAHLELFGGDGVARAVQNLGGIGNVTVLPARAGAGEVSAFDTGPANMVLDALMRVFSGGRTRYDRNGAMSAKAEPDAKLVAMLMRAPFFRQTPPKSTGRELFGRTYVARLIREGRRRHLAPEEIVSTAAELTARSIASGYERFVLPRTRVTECLLCGGGVHNRDVVARITRHLEPLGITVRSTAAVGVDPDAVEAIAFALLARETLRGRAGNIPRATGAAGPRVLGAIVPGGAGPLPRLPG